MSMSQAMRQMPARAGRAGAARGEATREAASDEADGPRRESSDTGKPHATLLRAAFTRENLRRALKRVRAKKGAAGVDGLDINQTAKHLITAWPAIREQLLAGVYRPRAVRRVCSQPSSGRSMQQVVDGLRPYLLGWKAYFGLAQTPGVWRELDEGLRHRLRAIQLKQWRRGTTIYRELRALGARPGVARTVATNSRRWWRNSGMLLNSVLTIPWFDRLGLPRLL